MVIFDLPVITPEQRREATHFRNFLLDDGFQMIQYSVYARPCVTHARLETHMKHVKGFIPPEGSIRAFYITKAQWDNGYVMYGAPAKNIPPESFPEQTAFW